jgi:hypothetical protein
MKQETKDLINKIVAADGNVQLQKSSRPSMDGPWGKWIDVTSTLDCLNFIAKEYSTTKFRIKPEPIPDRVYYDVIRTPNTTDSLDGDRKVYHLGYRDPGDARSVWGKNAIVVKLTISTDDTGVETKKVELV